MTKLSDLATRVIATVAVTTDTDTSAGSSSTNMRILTRVLQLTIVAAAAATSATTSSSTPSGLWHAMQQQQEMNGFERPAAAEEEEENSQNCCHFKGFKRVWYRINLFEYYRINYIFWCVFKKLDFGCVTHSSSVHVRSDAHGCQMDRTRQISAP
jgi:hypothetical protein